MELLRNNSVITIVIALQLATGEVGMGAIQDRMGIRAAKTETVHSKPNGLLVRPWKQRRRYLEGD